MKMSVWYEKSDPSDGTFFVGRHSSGRTVNTCEGVCDYELFPLQREDVDMLLYHMVWTFIMNPRDSWSTPLLLFPDDTHIVTDRLLRYPYLIADYSDEPYFYGEGGVVDDDDEFYMKACYVAEWDLSDGMGKASYRKLRKEVGENMLPNITDNTGQLRLAIVTLLRFAEQKGTDIGPWKERLSLTVRMLDTHANELHILHNAGLYDIETLWPMLKGSCRNNLDAYRIHAELTTQLHRYATMVVSTINWLEGGMRMAVS